MEDIMSEGGFLVRITGKDNKTEEHYCHAVSFDYDKGEYVLNNDEPRSLFPFSKIEILQDGE